MTDTQDKNAAAMQGLIDLMAQLRNPDGGCPWDIAQDFKSIAPYTIEEAYEVADAIEKGDMKELENELGDLLLQVVFHARMAEEAGLFDFADVAKGVTEKMISRHPHVYGNEIATKPEDVADGIWEQRKDKERAAKGHTSVLDDVAVSLPPVMRAQKLQKRAARVGCEWPQAIQVLDKMEEEIAELREAIAEKTQQDIHEEVGDMLFCVVNLGRMLDVDCETSLRDTNYKFERRFKGLESALKAKGTDLKDATLDQMEEAWVAEKQKEKSAA